MYKLVVLIAALSAAPAQVFGEEGPAAQAGASATPAGRQEVREAIRELRGAVRSPERSDRLREGTPGKLIRESRDRGERRSEHRERASLRR